MPFGYVPLNYEQIDIAAGTYTPSQVKDYNNQQYMLWQRALFQRACSTLKINLPKIWSENGRKDFFYYCLFAFGFVGCGELPEIGKWFNPVTLSGFDFYYQPRKIILSNPFYNSPKELEIGKDAEVIKLTPDYQGIFDVIAYYAEKLAVMDVAINTNIINSKFAWIIGSKNKAASATLKKLFDLVNRGEPAAFFDMKLANDGTDKEEPWQALFRDNIKQSYIVTDLLRDFQTVINDFDTEVGIPTLPYEKKERLVTSEAESKQIDATSRSIIWYETLKESFDHVNDFLQFSGDDALSVTLRYTSEEGGANDGDSENNDGRIDELLRSE